MPKKSLKTKWNMYSLYGFTIKQWLYFAVVAVIAVLVVGMIAAYYQNMERKAIENEVNIKYLQKANADLSANIISLSNSIAANNTEIKILFQTNDKLASQGKALNDSLKKLKLKYNEIGKRVDTLFADDIRRYFAELQLPFTQ